MRSIFTILICCITFIGYSQSEIILMPEVNFEKSKEKKGSSINLGNQIQLNIKGGYKILSCLYAGPFLGFETYKIKSIAHNQKRTQTNVSAGIFIGYFQKNFHEKKFSFNIISQLIYEKSYEKYIYLGSVSSNQYKNYRIELIPSIYIKCTSHFGINMGTGIYCTLPKTATPIKIKNYGLHPNIGFIISI